jgi:tetraacyldisaccharide 4'-kinase
MNLRPLLFPFSILYSTVAGIRNLMFDSGVLKSRRFTIPVILVGNLSVGGTGKTPHVEYLLRLLRKKFRTAVLSRGYGRKSTGFVMAGKGITAEQVGDEPMQYFSEFDDVTVAVCEKRVKGIEKLLELKSPQVIVMDDGFQHRWVDPGMKLLLTPFDNPFTSDLVLPAGDLREPRSGYRRASHIIVTRTPPQATDAQKGRIKDAIRPAPGQQVFFSSLEYGNPVSFFTNEQVEPARLPEKNVLLFTGIADPSVLTAYLEKKCSRLITERYPDHHEYSLRDAAWLRDKFDKFAGDTGIILTTVKDYQRMLGTPVIDAFRTLPVFYLPVRVVIDREQEFNDLILTYAGTHQGNR